MGLVVSFFFCSHELLLVAVSTLDPGSRLHILLPGQGCEVRQVGLTELGAQGEWTGLEQTPPCRKGRALSLRLCDMCPGPCGLPVLNLGRFRQSAGTNRAAITLSVLCPLLSASSQLVAHHTTVLFPEPGYGAPARCLGLTVHHAGPLRSTLQRPPMPTTLPSPTCPLPRMPPMPPPFP